jgi:hypothetical protein
MKPPQGEERMRKKEKDEEERERGWGQLASQSHRWNCRDWSHAMSEGVTRTDLATLARGDTVEPNQLIKIIKFEENKSFIQIYFLNIN